jgi:hypothetical protein
MNAIEVFASARARCMADAPSTAPASCGEPP